MIIFNRTIKNRIILLVTFLTAITAIGQNYELDVTGSLQFSNGLIRRSDATVLRNGIELKKYVATGAGATLEITTINETLNFNGLASLQLKERSNVAVTPPQCLSLNQTAVLNSTQAIEQVVTINGCDANFLRVKLIPRIGNISLGNGLTSEICIGNQLIINAPPGFPNAAYSWQFSTNNGTSWVDFPSSFNKTESIAATLEEIIGPTHLDHLGENIVFRVGQNNKRMFSNNTISILYSPCAPLVDVINYIPPNCNGESVNIIITFDRILENDETFSQITIVDLINGIQFGQETDVTTDTDGGNIFTFSNINELENNRTYFIRYQMKQNGILVPGFITSTQTFTYADPPPLEFEVILESEISCFTESDGQIRITINPNNNGSTGSGGYKYAINGSTPIPFFGATTVVSNLSSSEFNIKVFDSNNCTERQ